MSGKNDKTVTFEFENFRVDRERRRLFRDEELLPVTSKVFDLLLVFLEHPHEVLSKDELLDLVWTDSFVEEASLAQNVAVLRKVLGEGSKENRFIATVPGQGYKFVADVKTISFSDFPEAEPAFTADSVPSQNANGHWSSRPVLFATVILLAVMGIAAWVITRTGQEAKPSDPHTRQLTSWSGLDFYPSLSPDGNTVAFSSDRSGSFEIYIKQLVVGAREVQLTSDGGQNFEPAISPDGNFVAYHSKLKGGIWVIPITGGNPRKITEFGTKPAWSPDAEQIAFQSDPLTDLGSSVRSALPPSTIWRVSLTSGKPTQVTTAGQPKGGHGAPSWSHDGKRIAFDVSDWRPSTIWSIGVDGTDLKKIGPDNINSSEPVFSGDDRSIFCVFAVGRGIMRIDLTPSGDPVGQPVTLLEASGDKLRQPTVSKDGRRLAYSALATKSNIWKLPVNSKLAPAGPPVQLTQSAHSRNILPAYSPDGKKIAFQASATGVTRQIRIMDTDGNGQTEMVSDAAIAGFFPDGKRLGFIFGNSETGLAKPGFGVVDLETGASRRAFDLDEDSTPARLSPDGTKLALAMKKSGTTNIWICDIDGTGLRQVTFDLESAGFPSWSPDGKWIAVELKRGDDGQIGIFPSAGGDITQLTSEKGQSWSNDWTPDGDHIILAGQRNGIWNIYALTVSTRTIQKISDYTRLNSYVRYPTFSPLGDAIAYEYAETTGNVFMLDLK